MFRLFSQLTTILVVFLLFTGHLYAKKTVTDSTENKGVIHFVFGSDSSTPGINIRDKIATYRDSGFDLFTSPTRNTARIMDASFRNRYVDSNGEPFRFTWWMQGGSLYRFADNTNIPFPSLMSLNLINRYFGDEISQYGDEFTYHYHTWIWSDPNNDGVYHWNQTPNYIDTQADFFKNLAEALVEEDMFPVSFRSGWHFMDNQWQADLNDWLPFSLHNAYPANARDTLEPIDNLYVWKDATADFVPFQPQDENYQLGGGNRGWNVRSAYFKRANESLIREIFEAANNGVDQVPCIWSHVAENSFIEDLEQVFQTIEQVAAEYPDIEYRYDTAVEGMQRWLRTTDKTAPVLTVSEKMETNGYRVQVQTNEAIFQKHPFLAAKDVYEVHRVVPMRKIGTNSWESEELFTSNNAVSWSIAVSDSVGNQTKYHKDVLPDDIYLDNEDASFSSSGNWQEQPNTQIPLVWGRTAHSVSFANSTVSAAWKTTIQNGADYDAYIRFPDYPIDTTEINYSIKQNGIVVKSGIIEKPIANRWIFLDNVITQSADQLEIEVSKAAAEETIQLVVDAVKLSAYRKPVFIKAKRSLIDLSYIQKDQVHSFELELENKGFEQGLITSISSTNGFVIPQNDLGLEIASNSNKKLSLSFLPTKFGLITDTLQIQTSDPNQPLLQIELKAIGKPYFSLADNDDEDSYEEEGNWLTSVTQAYGSSSRYIIINQASANASATYSLTVESEGWYIASFLVPSATNSAIRASYTLMVNGEEVFSKVRNQNSEVTQWKWLDKAYLRPNDDIKLIISLPDVVNNGPVLRADAVQLELLGKSLSDIIVDNDSSNYTEIGEWATSSATSFGASSRYSSTTNARATYTINNVKAGLSELSILLPKTVNASKEAHYEVKQGDLFLGETTVNQNIESGDWVAIGAFLSNSEEPITVTLSEGADNSSNFVLRADAIKWSFDSGEIVNTSINETQLPTEVTLFPNYPNPFNPTTTIAFSIPSSSFTKLEVFNVQGQLVATLANERLNAGSYNYTFNAGQLSSGLYIVRLSTSAKMLTQKMMLIK